QLRRAIEPVGRSFELNERRSRNLPLTDRLVSLAHFPVRITIVQGPFLPVPPLLGGAVEKVWFSLGQEFARRGHEVTHVSRGFKDLPARETIEGVQHRRVSGFSSPATFSRRMLLDFWYAARVLGQLPPADILVTNT